MSGTAEVRDVIIFPRALLTTSRSKFQLWLGVLYIELTDCIVPLAMNPAAADAHGHVPTVASGGPSSKLTPAKVLFVSRDDVHVFHMDEVHYFSVQNLSKLN
jgi:hypothetical protein